MQQGRVLARGILVFGQLFIFLKNIYLFICRPVIRFPVLSAV